MLNAERRTQIVNPASAAAADADAALAALSALSAAAPTLALHAALG